MQKKYKKILNCILILIIVFTLSSNINAKEKSGFVTENGKTYYYDESGNLMKWWQVDENGVFYLQNDGSIKQGLQEINGIMYYIENNYIYYGEKEINNEMYIFSDLTGEMKYGSIRLSDNSLIYVEKNGKHYSDGWIESNGKKYYQKNKRIVEGFQKIGEKTYYFEPNTGKLKQWWQVDNNGVFYLQNDGSIKQGLQEINGIMYYIENNYIYYGEKEINNEMYVFSDLTGEMKYGSIRLSDNSLIYVEKNGKHYSDGWIESNGKKYYQKNKRIVEGFQKIGEKTYYFEPNTGKLKQWWQVDENGVFYLQSDGSIKQGLQEINGIMYYIENNYIYSGEKEINNEMYIFSDLTGEMKYGSIRLSDNSLIYVEKNGKHYSDGWIESNGNKYYQKNKRIVEGFQKIGEKTYYFEPNTGKLKQWWQVDENGVFYLQYDGSIKQGLQVIDGILYYIENNYIYYGEKEINGEVYFFQEGTGELKSGFFTDEENNKRYIEKDGTHPKGFILYNDDVYYIDNNGIVVTGNTTIENVTYSFDSTGKLIKNQLKPVYYSQKDERWATTIYGLKTMKSTGCAPTSMAMAFSAIKNTTILPTDVANYLYYNTQEFNRYVVGSSGLAIVYATDYFKIQRKPLMNKKDLQIALASGHIVFAAMGDGKYATKFWNHAIILFNYQNDKTFAYDPLKQENNGWVSLDLLLREQSKDPDDSRGGSNFYMLS